MKALRSLRITQLITILVSAAAIAVGAQDENSCQRDGILCYMGACLGLLILSSFALPCPECCGECFRQSFCTSSAALFFGFVDIVLSAAQIMTYADLFRGPKCWDTQLVCCSLVCALICLPMTVWNIWIGRTPPISNLGNVGDRYGTVPEEASSPMTPVHEPPI